LRSAVGDVRNRGETAPPAPRGSAQRTLSGDRCRGDWQDLLAGGQRELGSQHTATAGGFLPRPLLPRDGGEVRNGAVGTALAVSERMGRFAVFVQPQIADDRLG